MDYKTCNHEIPRGEIDQDIAHVTLAKDDFGLLNYYRARVLYSYFTNFGHSNY